MDKLSVIRLLPQTAEEATTFITDLISRMDRGVLKKQELFELLKYPQFVIDQLTDYINENE